MMTVKVAVRSLEINFHFSISLTWLETPQAYLNYCSEESLKSLIRIIKVFRSLLLRQASPCMLGILVCPFIRPITC